MTISANLEAAACWLDAQADLGQGLTPANCRYLAAWLRRDSDAVERLEALAAPQAPATLPDDGRVVPLRRAAGQPGAVPTPSNGGDAA